MLAAPPIEPFHLGPTWEREADGSWRLPEHTLGWDIIGWACDNLQLDGEPLRLTLEQARFILWVYAIDEHGRFIYREMVLQRMKGWGKDPIAAIMAAVEFVGPCRFGGWKPDGTPIVIPQRNAWVQICAVTMDQTKNTADFLPTIFTEAAIQRYGIDLGRKVTYALGGRRLEVVTSSHRSMEGNRPTFVIANETHHWIPAVQGHDRAAVIRRNLAKIKGGQARMLSITNAFKRGEDSVAERKRAAYENVLEGRSVDTGLLYDSLEAPPTVSIVPNFTRWDDDGREVVDRDQSDQPVPPSAEVVREHIRRVLLAVRGDAVWLDVDRLIEEILSDDGTPNGSTSVEEAKRFYFNSSSLSDDAAFDPDDLREMLHADITEARRSGLVDPLRVGWKPVKADEPIVMFGDGSKSDDSTGLIGVRVSDGYTFTLGVWQKPKGDRGRAWLAPREDIDARVHEVFERFNVVGFFFDPSHTRDDENANRYWDVLIDSWHIEFGDRLQYWAVQSGDRRSAIMWDMTSPVRQVEFVNAVARCQDEVESHAFTLDGHPTLLEHMRHARMTLTSHGWSISKESRRSSKKIDLAVCLVGARMLRRLVAVKGVEEAEVPAKVWW
jgi:hypothetical protein